MTIKPFAALLAATDLSPRSSLALERAGLIASEHGASLTLLHVLEPLLAERSVRELITHSGQEPALLGLETAKAALHSQAAAAAWGADTSGPVRKQVVTGKDFVEIIRCSRTLGIDLIVLGAHGENFLRDWILGTTAERVVRKGDRPVLVVKTPPRGPYERVLIAVDYSKPSRFALRQALRLAPGAEVHVLHVFEPWVLEIMQRAGTDPVKIAAARNDLLNEEFERLQAFLSGVNTEGQDLRPIVLDDPHPGNRINQFAETIGADLIAIGCMGASDLRSILLGSVAEHVLRESTCDVLAVREGAADFELP